MLLYINLLLGTAIVSLCTIPKQHTMAEYFSMLHSVLRARNHLTMGLKQIVGAQTARTPHLSYAVVKSHQALSEWTQEYHLMVRILHLKLG